MPGGWAWWKPRDEGLASVSYVAPHPRTRGEAWSGHYDLACTVSRCATRPTVSPCTTIENETTM